MNLAKSLNSKHILRFMKKIQTFILCIINLFAIGQMPEAGLVCYYPMNGNANDFSGNNYHGIVNGPVLIADRFGNINSAYDFDGINDYIDLSEFANELNFEQPASFSFWVNTSADIGMAVYSVSDATTGYSISMIAIGNSTTFTLTNEIAIASHRRDDSDMYIAGFTTTNRGMLVNQKWHHLAYIYDGIAVKIYIDGVFVPISSTYGIENGHYGNVINAAIAVLGTRYYSGYGAFLNGSLDDFRIYNRVLDSDEVNELLNEPDYASEIESINLPDFFIYPNPASEYLRIETNNPGFTGKIEIANVMGSVVFEDIIEQPEKIIELAEFVNGFYFVRIFDYEMNVVKSKKIFISK